MVVPGALVGSRVGGGPEKGHTSLRVAWRHLAPTTLARALKAMEGEVFVDQRCWPPESMAIINYVY